MSKGRYHKKKKKTSLIWIIVAVAVALAIAALAYFGVNDFTIPNLSLNDEKPEATIATDAQEQNQEPQNEATTHNSESAEATESVEATEATEATESDEQATLSTEPEQPQEIVPQPTVVITQREEAEYEKWLAAAQLVCVSMEYPDFQLEGVYAASATSMEDKFSSDGAYILFTSGGNRIAIHSKALDAERANGGTIDISTEAIGYATFDKVDPSSINVSAMEKLAVEDLSELISQSLLISIYTH